MERAGCVDAITGSHVRRRQTKCAFGTQRNGCDDIDERRYYFIHTTATTNPTSFISEQQQQQQQQHVDQSGVHGTIDAIGNR